MDMYSFGLEVKAIRSVTSPKINDKHRMAMLGRLAKEHFSNEVTRKTYRRLCKLVEVKNTLLTWSELLEDPNLSEEFRDHLKEADAKPIKSFKDFDTVYQQLDRYRQRRAIMKVGRTIAEDLSSNSDEDFDEQEYLQTLADSINQAGAGTRASEKIWTFGSKKSNALELAKRVVNSPQEEMLKTGFKTYDKRNGGLPTTGVLLLAGTTSGGKSVISQNLMDNIVNLNSKAGLKVTLEMTAEQEMNRHLSMISGVPFWKIKQRKLTDREKKSLLKATKEYNKKLRLNKAKYSFVSPERGMTIDDVLYLTVPYNIDVLTIDYVGLLEGVDDDNQWRKLSAIIRKAKVHASQNNQLVIILCQLDDNTGKIRYSGGMREHADVVWAWNYSDPEIRETKKIPVMIMKARDGELFEMPLDEAFEIMKVTDSGAEPTGAGTANDSKSFKKSKRKDLEESVKKNKRTSLLETDDEDDEEEEKAKKKKKKKKKYLLS